MKKSTKKQVDSDVRNRAYLQDKIRKQYGDRVMAGAVRRLCKTCKYEHGCDLIPITTKGEDCPYYIQRKLE